MVEVWNGSAASALRSALRMTNEQFAEQLGTGVRTVAKWNADPNLVPVTEMQRALDTMLHRASPEAQERFAGIMRAVAPSVPQQRGPNEPTESATAATERRLSDDPSTNETFNWLDEHAGWPSGSARRRVAAQVQQADSLEHRDRTHIRRQVGRTAIAHALVDFYKPTAGYVPYRASVAGQPIDTSILTRPEWLDLHLILGRGDDRTSRAPSNANPSPRLDPLGADAAVHRVAQSLAADARMVNATLYSLHRIDIAEHAMTAQFSITDFLSYALTLDLLEGELVDAIAAGTPPTPAALPLRQTYLPDLTAVTSVEDRLCAGGPLALFAAARRRSRRQPHQGDYVFLVQQRSARTINANRKLAVIPKAFHQPLVDFSDDTQVSATLEREMEEELFGSDDLDTAASSRADPLHASRLSPPMHWLMERTDADTWRIECTAFGLNLVSGNFEFASLIMIDDDEWWERFGGSIEANWEAEGLRRYSTLDPEGIARLVQDDSWSNEALFALLQGLRRLAEIDGTRVDLPQITLEM